MVNLCLRFEVYELTNKRNKMFEKIVYESHLSNGSIAERSVSYILNFNWLRRGFSITREQ